MSNKNKKTRNNKKPWGISQWLGLSIVTLGIGFFGSRYAYEEYDLEDEVKQLEMMFGIVQATEKAEPKEPITFTMETLDLLNALLVSEPIYREIIEEQQLEVSMVDIYNQELSDSDYKVLDKEYKEKYKPVQKQMEEKIKQSFLKTKYAVTYDEFLKDNSVLPKDELAKLYQDVFGKITPERLKDLEGITLKSIDDVKYIPQLPNLKYLAVTDANGSFDATILKNSDIESLTLQVAAVENIEEINQLDSLQQYELHVEGTKNK